MKLLLPVTLASTALVLSSCCCPQHRHCWCHRTVATPVPQPAAVDDREESGLGAQNFVRFTNPLPVPRYDQEGIYSCWSTCAQMIMDWNGVFVTQCEQADPYVFAEESLCCDQYMTLTSHCDLAGLPEFELWGFSCKHTFGVPLSWEQAKAEIDAGHPFAFSWTMAEATTASLNLDDQGSHMMVVIGYAETGGPNSVQTLHCLNPHSFDPTDELIVPLEKYKGGTIGTTIYRNEHNYFEIQTFP